MDRFKRIQKCSAMRARFRSLRDHRVHARLLQLARLFLGRRSAENGDAPLFQARHRVAIRDAKGETEDRRTCRQHRFELRRETDRAAAAGATGAGSPSLSWTPDISVEHRAGVHRLIRAPSARE